jgi:hypothetical protein
MHLNYTSAGRDGSKLIRFKKTRTRILKNQEGLDLSQSKQ